MDCDALRTVLFDHVDGLLGREEAEAARDHLAACAPCRALQEEVRRNFSALDAWEDEGLPDGAFERLQARIPSGPTPLGVPAREGSPAGGAAPAAARRRWLRLALPYAAGLATAAAAAWILVLPRGTLPAPVLPSSGPGAPGIAPLGSAHGGAVALGDAPSLADTGAAPLRAGERKLEFRDPDDGVLRSFRLPRDVDPRMVVPVDVTRRILPDDEGVR